MADRAEFLLRYFQRLTEQPTSDAGLLERFVALRDEDAFAALLARHGPMVLGVCRRVLGNAHAAEDVAQAAFLVLARRAAAIRPPERLAAWLAGVARHLALKCRRADARRRRRESLALGAARPAPPDPLAEVSARELLLTLDAEVARLPEVYRLPVLLCCLEGLSQEEAARRLGWTVGSVRGRLERGRARLHARLARRGLALSAALGAAAVARASVSGGWLAPTAKAAALVAAGQSAAGVVPAEVIALSEGVLRAMLRTRVILAAALVLGVFGAGAGALAFRGQGPEEAPPAAGAKPAKPGAEPDVYALLLVGPTEPRLLPGANVPEPAGDDAAYRRTQLALLKSRLVLNAALRDPTVVKLAAVKDAADPLAWLEENVRAAFVDNSAVLRVSVAAGGRSERAALTNAVVRAYMNEVVGHEHDQKVQRVAELEKLQAQHEDAARAKRQRLRKELQVLGASRSLKRQFGREDLASYRGELQRVRLKKVEAQARLNYLKHAAGPDAKRLAKLEEDVGVLAEQEKLLRAEIEPLAESAQAAEPDAAEVGVARDEIAAAEQTTRKIAAEVQALKVDLRAAPRVRLLEEASASRPKK